MNAIQAAAALAALYSDLADSPDARIAAAFATARDALSMGALPPVVAVEVITGKRTISDALTASAEVQEDRIADEEEMGSEALVADTTRFCVSLRAAAAVLRG